MFPCLNPLGLSRSSPLPLHLFDVFSPRRIHMPGFISSAVPFDTEIPQDMLAGVNPTMCLFGGLFHLMINP